MIKCATGFINRAQHNYWDRNCDNWQGPEGWLCKGPVASIVEIMADSTGKHPAEGTTVHKLCNEGGLLVAFETIGTLHQCSHLELEAVSDEEALSTILQWEVVGYGIPVIMANKNGVSLCLADVESGDKLCGFTISSASQYTVIKDDFHIFTKPSGCFGIGFSHSTVAQRIFAILKCTVACACLASVEEEDAEEVEGIEPPPKRRHTDECGDEDVGEDQVDTVFHKKEKKKVVISEPNDFQHLTHIGKDTSIIQLTQALSWTETLKRKEKIVGQVISIPRSNTELSSSPEEAKMQPPPPPPPPPAVIPPPAKIEFKKKKDSSMSSNGSAKDLATSLAEEIKRGVVLRPVSDMSSCSSQSSGRSFNSLQEELKGGVVLKSMMTNRTMTLPTPPRRRENEKLLFEIKTFRQKNLRNISMTDFPSTRAPSNENSLELVLKRSLTAMFKKVSDTTEIINVGSVDRNGQDTFNGLFSDA